MHDGGRLYDDLAHNKEQNDETQDSRGATATYASLIAYLARRHAFETHIDNQDPEPDQVGARLHQEDQDDEQDQDQGS